MTYPPNAVHLGASRPPPRALNAGAAASNVPARQELIDMLLRIAATVLAIALISILTFVPLSQNDFWLQAAVGRIIVQTGEIPHTVLFPFAWVRDNVFYAHEWLPSIAFYLLDTTLGYDRLLFVQGALGLILFGLSFGLAFRLSRSTALAILFACMAMVVANYRHFLRPELFALLLFVAELHLLTLYRLRGGRRFLVGCLAIVMIWANTHGSFVIGPVVAAIFALGEAIEGARHETTQPFARRMRTGVSVGLPYAITALGMIAVSLANPLGIELFNFVWTVSSSEVVRAFIMEWHPTLSSYFMRTPGFRIFVGCLVVTLATVGTCWRRLTATDVLMLLAFLLVALMRLRYVVLFGFVAMLVCSRLVGAGAWRRAWERVAFGVSIAASVVGIALALQFGNAYRAYPYYAPSTDLTKPMIDQLSKPGMQGNVFNSYELGAELIYRAYPRLRPSQDSRLDSYGDRYYLLQEQLFVDEPLLKDFIADFDIRYMLLVWRDFDRLKKLPGLRDNWNMQFADHKAVLLVRRAGASSTAPSAGKPLGGGAAAGTHDQ